MTVYVEMRYSNDGGHNYSNWQAREAGGTGAFLTPMVWRRLGRSRDERIWEFRDTSDAPQDLMAAAIYMEAE